MNISFDLFSNLISTESLSAISFSLQPIQHSSTGRSPVSLLVNPLPLRIQRWRIIAEDPRTSSSVNPSPLRNQRRRIIAEDLRTPASSSANQPLHLIAKKQRTAEDIRGSEAVKLAVSFLEDEFK